MTTKEATKRTTSKATHERTGQSPGRAAHKTVVVLPPDLASEIDEKVGARNRQKFVIENCVKELRRLEQLEAIREATGAWRQEAHPELEANSVEWQERMRRQWDGRAPRAGSRR